MTILPRSKPPPLPTLPVRRTRSPIQRSQRLIVPVVVCQGNPVRERTHGPALCTAEDTVAWTTNFPAQNTRIEAGRESDRARPPGPETYYILKTTKRRAPANNGDNTGVPSNVKLAQYRCVLAKTGV